MTTSVSTEPFNPPKQLMHCAACGEALYAGAPMRTLRDGAMHVGCHVLEMNKRRARQHLVLVVDNGASPATRVRHGGFEPAA